MTGTPDEALRGLRNMLDQYADKQAHEGYPKALRDGIAAILVLQDRIRAAEADADALAKVLANRDGGSHDEDCKKRIGELRGDFSAQCNCGHDETVDALAAHAERKK